MRYQFWILLLFLFSAFKGFSQEKYIKHVVAKGETISKIAEQYNVKQAVIYEINPDAKKGIKFKEILLVPIAASADKKPVATISKSTLAQKEHLVLSKETLYGIAKQYGVKVDDLYTLNPTLEKKGLRVGHTINVPDTGEEIVETPSKKEDVQVKVKEVAKPEVAKKEIVKTEVVQAVVKKDSVAPAVFTIDVNGNKVKEVLAKETLYGIARENGISVADLEKANPILETQSLRIGQKLIIPVAVSQEIPVAKTEEIKEKTNNIVSVVAPTIAVVENKTETKSENNLEVELTHEVLAKETKYGIAKQYGLTVKELEAQNPKIANKLLVGEKLTIHTSKSNVKTPVKYDFTDDSLVNGDGINYNAKSFQGTDLADQLISTASENIGVRYRSGGTTKDGFDCSGLMCSTFGAFDIQLPRSSIEQSQFGVKIEAENAQKGDLIFFKTNGRSQINHVGMVVEVCDGDIKFIHASVGGGVIISSIKEKYYSTRVTQINRVLYN